MSKSITEELQLNDKESRKKFYEKLAAHKDELLKYYAVKLPEYDQWEKDCETKMLLSTKARELKKKQDEINAKFKGNDRLFRHVLQLDGEDADKNNQDLVDTFLKDKKGYVNLVAKKLLAIDVKKEIENMQGKSDLELAEMYLKDPQKYDLAWAVVDIINNYGDFLEEDVKQKIQDNKLDLQSLHPYVASINPLKNELYSYLPVPEIDNLNQWKPDSINFGFEKNENMSKDINNFFVQAGMTTLVKLNEYNEAHVKSVGVKINDLLAACKDSEDKSWTNSKKYEAMKKALDDFKKNYQNFEKAEKSKENLKKAAKEYLAYKADKSMNQNAYGKVAAAGGILELIDEIDAHKPYDEKDVKPFIKYSKVEGIYEQRATEVYNKAKEQYGKKKEAVSLKSLEEAESGAKKEKKSSKVEKNESTEKLKSL